ncbi:MAG: hypothetical protein AB9844_07915 [Clostridiaceae bacterium]
MMKKVVIFGTTTVSKILYHDALGRSDFQIACFTVDLEYMDGNEFMGLPLVDFAKITELYPPEEFDMLAALSGYGDMRGKERLYLKAKSKGYFMRNYISYKSDFAPDVKMGENNIIMAQAHVGMEGVMGNNNTIRQNVYLGHNFALGNNNFIAAGSTIGGRCTIKNTCYIGLSAVIKNQTIIEDETLIGAGSVVIKNTEPYSKNVGNPSRIIGYHKEDGIKLV